MNSLKVLFAVMFACSTAVAFADGTSTQFATGNMTEAVQVMDTNKDHSVSKDEFLKYWSNEYDKMKKVNGAIPAPDMANDLAEMVKYLRGPGN